MYISIYDYHDYKKFLIECIELMPKKGRGQRIQLAQALGCQTPFITHVLTGEYHFSLEQAEACSRWIGLNETDSEFFVLLVMRQKSATKQAVLLFERQIERRKNQENVLKKRLKIKEGLAPEDQLQYYSHWLYAAIHMALLNPKLQTLEALQMHFNEKRSRIQTIIDFLIDARLIEYKIEGHNKTQKLKVKSSMIHLEKTSTLLPHHHTNFRLKAIDSIKEKTDGQLHYSSVISLSEEDSDWVRSRISLLLEELSDRVKNSADEKIAVLNFDWFKI